MAEQKGFVPPEAGKKLSQKDRVETQLDHEGSLENEHRVEQERDERVPGTSATQTPFITQGEGGQATANSGQTTGQGQVQGNIADPSDAPAETVSQQPAAPELTDEQIRQIEQQDKQKLAALEEELRKMKGTDISAGQQPAQHDSGAQQANAAETALDQDEEYGYGIGW